MLRRPAPCLLGALLCAGLALLVRYLAFHVHDTMWADGAALNGFGDLRGTPVASLAESISVLVNPVPYAIMAAFVLLHALHARGPRGAFAVLFVLTIPNAVTQELKPALAIQRLDGIGHDGRLVDPASWPSGHSTAAMSLALAAVIAAPAAGRFVVAIAGALFAVAVAYSVVLLGWHYPSDALGGFAVAGGGACLALAGLAAADRRWRPGTGRAAVAITIQALRPLAVWGAGVFVLAGVILAIKVAAGLPSLHAQAAFLAFTAAIVALGIALATGLAYALRR